MRIEVELRLFLFIVFHESIKLTDCSDIFYLFLKIQRFVNFEQQTNALLVLAQAPVVEYLVKFDVSVLSSHRIVLRLLYFEQIDTLSEKSKTRNLLNVWTFTTVAGHEYVEKTKKNLK